MGNRYLIVSDLHLCDVEEHPDGWKAYKSARYLYDADFAELLRRFVVGGAGHDRRLLVLNGDIFDFDLVSAVPPEPPWPVRRSERKRGLEPTEAKSAWKLQRMLNAHPRFVEALAEFLEAGGEIVYLMGNHDREFHFPAVKQTLADRLQAALKPRGRSLRPEALRFEPWFYYAPGEIYVEHGQQFDHYTSFRHLFDPTMQQGGETILALPMGNLSNRYLLTRMGFFNPHASDYILNVFSYAWHWLRHYAFSRRGLALIWFWGSLVVMGKLLRMRKQTFLHRPGASDLAEVAKRYGLEPERVEALHKLQRPPITTRFFLIVREFWIDRLLLGLLAAGGTIALALVPIPLWIKLMVPLTGFPLLFFIYEWAMRGDGIFGIERQFPRVARRIASLLPVRLVTLGHTHVPVLLPLVKGVVFVDTGTWAPITSATGRELKPGYRNYLLAAFEGDDVQVHFDSWLPAEEGEVPESVDGRD